MNKLDTIEQKALEIAERSDDSDSLLKALQIVNLAADSRQKAADFEQTSRENNRAGQVFERTKILAKILTPVLPVIAILLTAGTLIFQIVQFSNTSDAQRKSTEDTAWHATMKNVVLQPPSAVLVAAFDMQSFLSSPRYDQQARAILATLLPNVEDSSGFDVVFSNLHRTTNKDQLDELVGIARVIAAKDHDTFKADNHGTEKSFRDFVQDPTAFYGDESDSPVLHLALVRSWEIDSISQGLSYFWAPNTARYKGSPSGHNLSGIILESNFTDVNFSSANLESAMFWGATVTNTDFSGISKFKNSQWQHTNWWNANKMSCDLVRYLMREYPPNNSDDVSTSQSLSARSCSGSGKASAN
jgi:hypothetical protein